MTAPRRGLRHLFECEDCHTRRMVAWVERTRAAKPRCYSCGSTRLEIVSEEARDDIARLNRERLSGATSSLVLSKSIERADRKRVV